MSSRGFMALALAFFGVILVPGASSAGAHGLGFLLAQRSFPAIRGLRAWNGAGVCRGVVPRTLRSAKGEGVIGSRAIWDKMRQGLVDGINDAFAQPTKDANIEQLKGALGESEFDSVKSVISSLMQKQRAEQRQIAANALAEQKKLQNEV